MKCLRLRVQTFDFKQNEILIRDGKGFKDRVTMLVYDHQAGLVRGGFGGNPVSG